MSKARILAAFALTMFRRAMPWLRSYGGLVVGSVLAVAVVLWWLTDRDQNLFGTTDGIIVVDFPEVFSRERLVNDRFKQSAWLQGRLEDTKNVEWGIQGQTRRRTTSRQGVSLTYGAQSASTGTTTPAERSVEPERQVDSNVARSDQDQAKERQSGVAVSPIDDFHDTLAYREELRTALMEAQLDDRHDIAGNTLYRTKFSVTVFPENDTSAWAVVFVEITQADSGFRRPNYADIYREWLEYYQDQLNGALERMALHAQRNSGEFDLPRFASFVEGKLLGYFSSRERLTALAKAKQIQLQQAAAPTLEATRQRIRRECANTPQVVCPQEIRCDAGEASEAYCPKEFSRYGRLLALLEVYRDVLPEDERRGDVSSAALLRSLVADYLIEDLNRKASSQFTTPIWMISKQGCEIGLCRIVLAPADGGGQTLAAALDSGHQVFSYAVGPKEAVQRISNLAASTRDRQLAVGGGTGKLRDSTRASVSEAEGTVATSILRKPLIVGFSGEGGLRGGNNESSDQVARFGWIIGPRIVLDERGRLTFRHSPIQNDVSAIISVPSWWRWANARVAACWIDERHVARIAKTREGFLSFDRCKAHAATAHNYPIQLPGGVTEIARKIGLDVVRRPSVTLPVYQTVQAGRPAEFLIIGNHLWRSTVVLLGGQPADEIIVLPDMKGIVARFNDVEDAAATPLTSGSASGMAIGDSTTALLWVWTSEGSIVAGNVTVFSPKQKGRAAANPATDQRGGAAAKDRIKVR